MLSPLSASPDYGCNRCQFPPPRFLPTMSNSELTISHVRNHYRRHSQWTLDSNLDSCTPNTEGLSSCIEFWLAPFNDGFPRYPSQQWHSQVRFPENFRLPWPLQPFSTLLLPLDHQEFHWGTCTLRTVASLPSSAASILSISHIQGHCLSGVSFPLIVTFSLTFYQHSLSPSQSRCRNHQSSIQQPFLLVATSPPSQSPEGAPLSTAAEQFRPNQTSLAREFLGKHA